MPTTTINLVVSAAPLLSSETLTGCQNSEDPTCKGGVAAVAAYARHYAKNEPVLVFPQLDSQSHFVQAHPLGWNVNRKVFQQFGWNVFSASPSLLTLTHDDTDDDSKNDLSGLQTPSMSLLLSNVAVPPSNSWQPYLESVHFDAATGIALVSLVDETENDTTDKNGKLIWPQVESALGALDYIAAQNRRQGCSVNTMAAQPQQLQPNVTTNARASNKPTTKCWIPVILVHASSGDSFNRLILNAKVGNHANPPVLIMDLGGGQEDYRTPKVLQSGTMWVVSHPLTEETYLHSKLTMDLESLQVIDLALISHDLNKPLPSDLILQEDNNSTSTYASDIQFLRGLVDEAIANNPALGLSNIMPFSDDSCAKKECEMGNLFADSLRWKTNTDISLIAGHALQGPGWSYGMVKMADVWTALPNPTTICTGHIRGASLLQVLDGAVSSNSASQFLQVSGMQINYNHLLRQGSTKLVSVKVWDFNELAYLTVNPRRLYSFAAASDVCTGLGGDTIEAGLANGDTLMQNTLGEYLRQLDSVYVPLVEGRLQDAGAGAPMDLVATAATCAAGSYWNADTENCLSCPDKKAHVTLSDERVDFTFKEGTSESQTGRVMVVNRDLHDFVLVSKGTPAWFEFTAESTLASTTPIQWPDVPLKLTSGETIAFDYAINTTNMVGVTFATVFFNVSDYKSIPGCFSDKYALPLDTLIQVTSPDTTMHLGFDAVIGMIIMGVVLAICAGLLLWVFLRRERWGYGNLGDKSMKSIQPLYLGTICLGVLIMALTIAPLSVNEPEMSGLCLAAPWLLSMGLTLVFSALLSKLSTAKKMFETLNLREIQISTKDLMRPFIILFGVNFAILFCMLIDPPIWGQQAAQDESDWKFYGVCQYNALSSALAFASGLVHLLTLVYTCVEAYRVSNMSDEFRELKIIGLSVFVWLQMTIIVIPFWFILDDGNVPGKYYFKVGTICALCLSMLLCTFVPVVYNKIDAEQLNRSFGGTEEDSPSVFGGFLGFTKSVGGDNKALPMVAHEDLDEGNRCMADRLCY